MNIDPVNSAQNIIQGKFNILIIETIFANFITIAANGGTVF